VAASDSFSHYVRDFQEWTDGDVVFSALFSTCITAGDACPLSAMNATAVQLEQATWDVLESLKQNPIPFGSQVIDYSFLKRDIQNAMYGPKAWGGLVATLDVLFNNNATEIEALGNTPGITIGDDAGVDAAIDLAMGLAAIHCSDTKRRVATFEEFSPVLDKMYNISSVMGDGNDAAMMRCAQWKIGPKERYEGGFTVQTKNPVLFIGTKWDAYTPLLSAYNVSSGFNGSTVLEINGYGVSRISSSF
jgi:hypothetical protein